MNLEAMTDPYIYATRSQFLKTSLDQIRKEQIALELWLLNKSIYIQIALYISSVYT